MTQQRLHHSTRHLPHQDAKNTPWQRGQALIEYVLILVLAFIGLIAILVVTAPAVGNVFSNTVYNLLGQTTTPQQPLSPGEFWNLITAVASYTPEPPDLVANTPAPTTMVPTNIPTWTSTPNTPTPTASITSTAGPSPTPLDIEFPYPFYDDGTNPDNFQDDFLDLLANAGPWDAEYWDGAGNSAGDCNTGSDPFFNSSGVPQRPAKVTNQVAKIDFPNPSAPSGSWRTLTDTPTPGVENSFCTRFEVNINLDAATYSWRYKKDDGIRIYVINGASVEQVVNSWTGITSNWVTVNWTNTSAGNRRIRIIHRDTASNAELRVRLYMGGQTSDDNCTWQTANERFKTPPTSWDDSPFVDYQNSQYCVLRLRGYINLLTSTDPILEFYHAYELHNFDKISVGISIYESGVWNDKLLRTGSDTNFAFSRERYELKNFTGSQGTRDYRGQNIELRFVLETDSSNTRDGWWIDDIRVLENQERVFFIGFGDDVEQDQFWVGSGNWARTTEKARSGQASWTDSPGANYVSNTNSSLELDGRLNLLGSNTIRPEIVFWSSWDLNTGDRIFVELSTDRTNWSALRTGPGDTTDWLEEATSEPQFVQSRLEIPDSYWALDRIYVRFRLYSNNDTNVKQGWWVDDIEFRNKPFDTVAPTWCDNMEEGTGFWLPTGDWAQTTASSYDGTRSWTDSPAANYTHGSNTYLELLPYIDLSSPSLTFPILEFWHHWDINDSNDSSDKLYVEISANDGNTWTNVWNYSSNSSGNSAPPGFGSSIPRAAFSYNRNDAWTREVVDLSPWLGLPASGNDYGIRLRFRLDARSGTRVGDGWYLDTVCLRRNLNNTITLPFADDLEAGIGNWLNYAGWRVSNEAAYSGNFAFTESPGGNYATDTYHLLELKHTVNLIGTTKPTLYYWERYTLAQDDRLMVHIQQVDADGIPISNWSYVAESNRYRTTNMGWSRAAVDLRPFVGQYVRIRFEVDALTNAAVADGTWIDQISIVDRTDEIQYRADPYYEDVETLAPGEWVLGHKWDTVSVFRNLGSGGSLGPGQWTATWYDNVTNTCSSNATLASQVGVTTLDQINYDWGNGFPAGTGITNGDTFGAIFRRTLVYTQPTTFNFTGDANAAIRIYDNGVLAYEYGWTNCPSTTTFTSPNYTFTTGTHNVEVRYYETTGSAKIVLGFSGESMVFHDSPTGNYEHLTDTRVELEGEISLIGLTDPVLFWEHRYAIGSGDNMRVQVSTDEGFNWFTIFSQGSGTDLNWTEAFVDLTPYRGNKIVLRFQLDARTNTPVGDGWWVDNIRIIE